MALFRLSKSLHQLFFACLILLGLDLKAQSSREVAVEISAVDSITHTELRWKSDTGVIRYFVYKRPYVDSNWILLDSMSPSILQYEDTNSVIGQSVEYRIAKKKNNFTFQGNGYIHAGFQLKETTQKGKILILIDSQYSVPLFHELNEYYQQLRNEGFQIIAKTVLRTDSVGKIKDWIFKQWQSDSLQIKCVLLLGHVPVPYSGDMSPDGHTDHRGAWPADNYYGCFYQKFTDITVNRNTASRPANRNVPGDGKFDLSRLNPIGTTWPNTKRYQLPVGRVDLYDMPAFGTDTMLMKRYLRKNLAFRQGDVQFPAKALVDDNFGYFAGEAFASGGYRNFSTYVGDSLVDGDYTGTGMGMKSTKYLWSYGCGGGSYTSCSGVSNSYAMVLDSLLNPFTMVFGSYFGDWDNTNNFLRSPLASKGWGLVSVWSGRPYWVAHASALGEPLYASIKATWNAINVYNVGSNGSGVHVAFMGDPTLRVFPVANVKGLSASDDCNGRVVMRWKTPIDQADSLRIDVLKNGDWIHVSTVSGSDTLFMKQFAEGRHWLSLRSKKLMKSASGSWWDLGARSTILVSVNHFDTLKISTDQTMKCSGDTFRIKGLHKKLNSSMLWTLDGAAVTVQDSVWNVASNGQGNLKVSLSVTTDSGCVSADSLLLFSVPPNDLKWNGKTDSTIQVKSKLNLPIQWYRNDTLIAGETDTILRISKSGIYRACTTSGDTCTDCSDTLQWFARVLGVNKLSGVNGSLKLFPNPTSDGLSIQGLTDPGDVRWKVFDLQGKLLIGGLGDWVDVSALKAGCYVIHVVGHRSFVILKQ
ncbi:MAG: hypothetical protein RLZZ47_86 [Bacteroidota bacterium]|jgi:hypothetical protein